MSTLEELKKQASEATLRNQTQQSGPSEEERWRKLAPVMKYLKQHFTEFAETLNVLEKDIIIDFQINDSVTMKRLKAGNYKVIHPTADKEKDWVFEIENGAENPTYAVVPVGPGASNFKTLLSDNQLQCVTTPVPGNKNVKFEIKPPLRTKYRFTADVENERIGLTIRNYENFWSQTNYFKKEDITQELMDELTRHIMREDNKYNEMVGNTISEEAKTQLRAKLQADITAKKQKEEADAQAAAAAKKDKTLLGKFFGKK